MCERVYLNLPVVLNPPSPNSTPQLRQAKNREKNEGELKASSFLLNNPPPLNVDWPAPIWGNQRAEWPECSGGNQPVGGTWAENGRERKAEKGRKTHKLPAEECLFLHNRKQGS